MTPQDWFYWVPIILGAIGIFGISMPLGMKMLFESESSFWLVLCVAGMAGVCIPIIQWFVLIAIAVMSYKVIFKELK